MENVTNVNSRADFILKQFSDLNANIIISIALPFMAMHSMTAKLTPLVTAYQVYAANSWSERALLITTTAFGRISPLGQLAFSSAFQAYQLHQAKENKDRLKLLLQMTSQAIHISSAIYGTPALIVLSLLSQATGELIDAYKHYSEGKKYELIASLLLATIRGKKVYSIRCQQNQFDRELKELDQNLRQVMNQKPRQIFPDRELWDQVDQTEIPIGEWEQKVNRDLQELDENIRQIMNQKPRQIFPDKELWDQVALTEMPVQENLNS